MSANLRGDSSVHVGDSLWNWFPLICHTGCLSLCFLYALKFFYLFRSDMKIDHEKFSNVKPNNRHARDVGFLLHIHNILHPFV